MKYYKAFITKDWRDIGLANVLVARIDDGGGMTAGFFLVDVFCLGVKDAVLLDDLHEDELDEIIEERFPEDSMEAMHPAWAKKLIEGAVAYAERLGFAPARDYRKARRVLGGIDAGACRETFVYGDDGRPHYVQGASDGEERIRRVLAVLDARCGPDGYIFTPAEDMFSDPDISDEDIAETRKTLADVFSKRVDNFSVDALTGELIAMLCRPDEFNFEDVAMDWGDILFDGDETDDADDGRRAPEAMLLEFYWHQLKAFLEAEMQEDYPVLIPRPDERASREEFFSAMFEWVQGFMGAVENHEEEWAGALARPDLAQYWRALRGWADPLGPDGIVKLVETGGAAGTDTGSGLPKLNDAVVAIHRALREEA
jgi:hypothetical protein